ncbi:aspartate aminotransferase family protein [Thalassobacillus sp. CUG 92003]|uniref:pyridoxal phosphate-dependent decarboxylase family protein n=1 Tax=Thalassobacillus sp. CUG 92003 TaxID=2736641 RepID=UPI0015E7CBBA|nr:aspartate aminotransferase family protein [Thalassobacillus sp. CUG 92003]
MAVGYDIKENLAGDQENYFEDFFLHRHPSGVAAYEHMATAVVHKLAKVFSEQSAPYEGQKTEALQAQIKQLAIFSYEGESLEKVLDAIEGSVLTQNVNISHERAAAHLHCPPLLPALAGEMILSAFNQSMDSWDQSPAATFLEMEMINWLTAKFGFSNQGDGSFTSGGTQSNYMGLLLARDAFCHTYWGRDVQKEGLPEGASRMRILCSEESHFTVKQAAAQLGLGEDAVVSIPTDEHHRLSLEGLNVTIKELADKQLLPFALVGTCGTTDFGSIDPLPELAETAKTNGLWFHVDAAYGGALMLSHHWSHKLAGIEQADSLAVDFHKMFFQPISCGAFLVKDRASFRYIQHHAAYLNPEDDEEDGAVHLVNKSIQTSRRFDALKLFLSLRTIGTKRFGHMIDHTLQLAGYAAEYADRFRSLTVLTREPALSTVILRYTQPMLNASEHNQINRSIQKRLFHGGEAVIAKTTVDGANFLKLTLLNPAASRRDIEEILHMITRYGDEAYQKWREHPCQT